MFLPLTRLKQQQSQKKQTLKLIFRHTKHTLMQM